VTSRGSTQVPDVRQALDSANGLTRRPLLGACRSRPRSRGVFAAFQRNRLSVYGLFSLSPSGGYSSRSTLCVWDVSIIAGSDGVSIRMGWRGGSSPSGSRPPGTADVPVRKAGIADIPARLGPRASPPAWDRGRPRPQSRDRGRPRPPGTADVPVRKAGTADVLARLGPRASHPPGTADVPVRLGSRASSPVWDRGHPRPPATYRAPQGW